MGRQFKPGQLQTGSLYNISSSYALTASYAANAGGSSINTGSFVTTASFYAFTASYTTGSFTGSFVGNLTGTASFITSSNVYGPYGSNSVATASYAETASFSLATTENRILVLNQSGQNIAKGVVVHITASGNSSDIPRIITASFESDNVSANTLGISSQLITNGTTGYVTTEGVLTGINTSAFVSGQLVYLGASGSITGSAPLAPLHAVRLGQVIREQSVNGSIYVRIDNGYELGELHDVRDSNAGTTTNYGDLLVRSGSVWTNTKQLSGSYGLTGSLTATSFTGSLSGTATSASWAPATFPYTGSALITGSLGVTGSFSVSSSSQIILNGPTGTAFTPIVAMQRNGTNAFYIDEYGSKFNDSVYLNTILGPGVSGISLGNQSGTGKIIYAVPTQGTLAIGYSSTTTAAALDIKAQGALSTDLAFRVRNSIDNDNILTVKGDMSIQLLGSGSGGYLNLSRGSGANVKLTHRGTATLPSNFIIASYGDGGSIGQIILDAFAGDGTTPTFTTQRLISGLSDLSGSALYTGFGSNAATFVMKNALNYVGYGIVPTGTATDHFAMYSADANGTAGAASPHFRTEDGSVLWLGTSTKLFNVTASLVSASFIGNLTGTASFATSASWAPSIPAFPYTGSALITGSLGVTGSMSIRAYTGSADTIMNITSTTGTQYFKAGGDGLFTLGTYTNPSTRLSVVGAVGLGIYCTGQGTAGYFQNETSTGTGYGLQVLARQYGSASPSGYVAYGIYTGADTTLGINYGLRSYAYNGATNYAGYFDAASGTNNYAIVTQRGYSGFGQTTPAAMVDIKAAGALSSDIVLRSRDSGDTQNLIDIRGNGQFTIGLNAQLLGTTDVYKNVVIGGSAKDISVAGVTENAVAIGYNAISNNGGTALGANTTIAGVSGVAVGASAYAGIDSTAIGSGAKADGTSLYQSLAIGKGARASGLLSGIIAVGQSSYTNALAQTLAFCVDPSGANSQTILLTNKANLIFRNSTQLTSGTHWDTTATNTLTIHSGSIPATTVSGAFQMYAATGSLTDNTRPHFRTGNGTTIWLGDESRLYNVTASNLVLGTTSAALFTSQTTTVNVGTTTIYAFPTASYDGVFIDYTARSGSNARAGQLMGIWSGSAVNYTETTTTDFGSTSAITFGMSVSASSMIVSASATTAAWAVKTIIRSI